MERANEEADCRQLLQEAIYDRNNTISFWIIFVCFLVFAGLGAGLFTQTDVFQKLGGWLVYVPFGLVVGFQILIVSIFSVGRPNIFWDCPSLENPTPCVEWVLYFLKFVGYCLSLALSVLLSYDDERSIFAVVSSGCYSVGLLALCKMIGFKSDHGVVGTTVGIYMAVGYSVLMQKRGGLWKSFLVLISASLIIWFNNFIGRPETPVAEVVAGDGRLKRVRALIYDRGNNMKYYWIGCYVISALVGWICLIHTDAHNHLGVGLTIGAISLFVVKFFIAFFLVADRQGGCCNRCKFKDPKSLQVEFFLQFVKYLEYLFSLAASVLLVYSKEATTQAIVSAGFYCAALFALCKLALWNSDHGIVTTAAGILMVVGSNVLKNQHRHHLLFVVVLVAAFFVWANDFIIQPPPPAPAPVRNEEHV